MKRNLLTITGAALLAFSIIGFITFGPVFAQAELQNYNSGGNFSGTYDVAVTIRNCQNNAAIRTFPSVTTFMQGGTLIDSTSNIPQSRKTPGQGAWSHTGGNTYSFRFKHFNFDDSGNYTGWNIVRQTVYFDPVRNEYTSRGTVEIFDPNGNLLLTGCSTTTAKRFE